MISVIVSEKSEDIEEISAQSEDISLEMMSDEIWLSIGDEHFKISNRKEGLTIRRSSHDTKLKKKKAAK